MREEQAIFNLEIKKKSGLSINTDIHHSKVFSSGIQVSRYPGFRQVSRYQGIQVLRYPGIQVSDIQNSRYPGIQLFMYPGIRSSSYPVIQLSMYPGI